MSDKDLDKEYLCIKEFAELVGITIETLRHYEKKGIFYPAKRGIELENQYRYYSLTQIPTIKILRMFAEIGIPLQTIKELTKSRTPEKLIKLLIKYKDKVAYKICFLQVVISVISTFLELLGKGISATEAEIYITEIPDKQILLGNINDFGDSIGYYNVFARFCSEPHKPKLNLSYPVGSYFESMDVFLNKPSQPTRFFSFDPNGYECMDAGLYLIGSTRGRYGQTNDLPKRMVEFAKEKGLVFNGPVYNIYLLDEMSIIDPEHYLLQVSASINERRQVPRRIHSRFNR